MILLASSSTLCNYFFFFQCSRHHRDLHSFPTRRSSDLRIRQFRPTIIHAHLFFAGLCTALTRAVAPRPSRVVTDRKSTRLNSSHVSISYAVFCLKKKKICSEPSPPRIRRAAKIGDVSFR